ncbi:MAG: 50S ribosomal protein L2 [Candidatus Nanoarchaeia archaeon]
MGKRTTGRAKGKGSLTFQVRKRAYIYRIGYPKLETTGKAKIINLINSLGHTSPLAKIAIGNEAFFSPAANNSYVDQEIEIGGNKIISGNIIMLKEIPQGTKVFNIEAYPGSGGKLARSGGCSATVVAKEGNTVEIIMGKRSIKLNESCRATIGIAAGDQRLLKPMTKAGKKHHLMLSRGKKWHRTSAIKTNAVDHPFGSGRGKRIKSKIAKRNSPPGAKVGHIRPRRTGRAK